jgi:hypothetical protein
MWIAAVLGLEALDDLGQDPLSKLRVNLQRVQVVPWILAE